MKIIVNIRYKNVYGFQEEKELIRVRLKGVKEMVL